MSRGSRGFSLIEILIALTLTALCIGLVAAGFGATYRAHARAMEHMELEQTVSQTIERIRVLLQSAFISPYQQNSVLARFETFDIDSLSEPYDAITFTTLFHTSYKPEAKQSNLAEITIFTTKEPPLETPEGRVELHRLRVRVGGDINDRFEVEGGQVYTLADHVTLFLLEYLDEYGEWKPEWVPADRDVSRMPLPCAVRVTLGVRSETLAEETASLIVPFETTELGCAFEDERPFEQ